MVAGPARFRAKSVVERVLPAWLQQRAPELVDLGNESPRIPRMPWVVDLPTQSTSVLSREFGRRISKWCSSGRKRPRISVCQRHLPRLLRKVLRRRELRELPGRQLPQVCRQRQVRHRLLFQEQRLLGRHQSLRQLARLQFPAVSRLVHPCHRLQFRAHHRRAFRQLEHHLLQEVEGSGNCAAVILP